MRFAIVIVLCAIVLLGGACDGSERVREEIRKCNSVKRICACQT